ncbi:ArsR/SmtB family transcription factor [Devosia geojensis]|uniref:ArsR/SmtB family transcription factor n=1 Tax=Devosia geojensis TaxID=443610 RepID=UPI000695F2B3|nr:metalloregulator ArsR/SmtB family transcription factor [Devosia geojensis]
MSLHALQFAALGDPTRCRIVELLAGEAMPVHALAGRFDISRPAISRHLRVLREAGIVREEKMGRENLYALRREQLGPARDWIAGVFPSGTAKRVTREPAASRTVPKTIPAKKASKAASPKVRAAPAPPSESAGEKQMEFDL